MRSLDFNSTLHDYEEVNINGKNYLFTDLRVDRKSVPKGYYAYDLRDNDRCSGEPCTVEKQVLVNFWGTIITPKQISEAEKGFLNIKEFGYNDVQIKNPVKYLEKQKKQK